MQTDGKQPGEANKKSKFLRAWDWCAAFVDGAFRRLFARSRTALVLLALVLLAIAVSSSRIVKPRETGTLFGTVSDFHDYYSAAEALVDGGDPYRLDQLAQLQSGYARALAGEISILELAAGLRGLGSYLYPPFTAFTLTPLTALGYQASAAVFSILSLLALFGFYAILYQALAQGGRAAGLETPPEYPRRAVFAVAALASALLILDFLLDNAANGNVGFWLVLLCGGGLVLCFQGGRRAEILGGILLGLAVAIKVTPAFFGLVLLGGRRFVAIVAMGLGLLIGLLSPALLLGWDANLALLHDWRELILETFRRYVVIRPWANNQSLSGAVGKLLLPAADPLQVRYGLPLALNGASGEARLGLAKSIVTIGNYVLYGLGLTAAGLTAWIFERERRDGASTLREAGAESDGEKTQNQSAKLRELFRPEMFRLLLIATLASLIGSGVSWYHAYTALLPALAFRMYGHFQGAFPLERADRFWILALFFFGALYPALPDAARDWLSIYSIFVWLAALVLLDQLRLLLRDLRRSLAA